MRATEFLREDIEDQQKVWSMIQQNCQPFINEIGGVEKLFSLPIYRGSFDSQNNTSIREIPVLPNRKPRNTQAEWHKAADEWFASTTGVLFRSHAIFADGNKEVGDSYGRGYSEIVIPIRQFNYCWSDIIRDMTLTLERTPREDDESEGDFVWNILDEGGYRFNSGLADAAQSECEIMINCEKVYLINPGFFYMIKNRLQDGSIK